MDDNPEAEADRLEVGARQLQQRAESFAALRRTLMVHFRGPAADRQQRRLLRHQRDLSVQSAELRALARALRTWAHNRPPTVPPAPLAPQEGAAP